MSGPPASQPSNGALYHNRDLAERYQRHLTEITT